MILNVLGLVLLVALALFSAWLGRRAAGAKMPLLRRFGPIVFALGTLGFLAVIAIALFGFYRLNTTASHPVTAVKVAGTPDQIARGQKLASLCVTCHSSAGALPLDGSTKNVISKPPIGTLYSPNLTPGGPIKALSDGEVLRALREGIDKNGRPLLGMTSWSFRYLSDDDAQAIIAYLRSQPAVAHDVPARDLNLLAGLAVGAGLAPTSVQPAIATPIVAPKAAVSAEYGRYLVAFSGCRDCHGKNLNGGTALLGIEALSPVPLGPSLLVKTKLYDQAGFVNTIRTGTRPNGLRLPNDRMPWKDFNSAFSDDELKAMFQYLNTVDAAAAATP